MIGNSEFVRSVSGRRVWSPGNYVCARRVLARGVPRIPVEDKNDGAYTYPTSSKKFALDMEALSLYSLCRNYEVLPSRVVVVYDESWESEYDVRYYWKRWLALECLTWKHSSLHELAIWEEKHIRGKTMVAILYSSEPNWIMFSAPDVLWRCTPPSEFYIPLSTR